MTFKLQRALCMVLELLTNTTHQQQSGCSSNVLVAFSPVFSVRAMTSNYGVQTAGFILHLTYYIF